MAQVNMFEMLGLAPKEEKKKEEKKATSTKKTSGNKSKTSGGSMTKDNFSLSEEGLTIVTGFYPEKTIELSAFDKEAGDTVSASEVFKVAIANGLESFVEGKTKFAELKNGKVLMVSDGIAMTEPKKKFQGEYRILLGGYETTYDAEEFGMDEVKKTWFDSYPEHDGLVDFQYDTERKIIVPVFKQKAPKESKEGVLAIWGQDPKQFKDKKVSDAAKELYGDLEGNYHLVSTEETTYYVVPYIKSGVATAKEVMYPTSDVTLSLVFTRICLTPEMFGGKEKVTEKELLKVITDDYPEYGDGRATVNYLKKEKLIVVSIKSAKKGAGLCHARFNADMDNFPEVKEQALKYVTEQEQNHVLCYIDLEGNRSHRIEKNEIGIFSGGVKNHSGFTMKLPRIPRAIMEEIYSFFLAVKEYMPRSNEAAAQVFWDKSRKEYFVYYPDQTVSTTSVDFKRNTEIEISRNNILVMDVHSHGVIRPIFSGTDDRDEKGTRLYCVLGDMHDTTAYHFSLRAGTGGNFIAIHDEDVFEDFFNGMFTNDHVIEPKIYVQRIISEKVTFA